MATTIASAANLCALHVMQDDTVQAAPVAGAAPAAAPTPPGQLITAFIQAILSLLNAGTLCGNVPATLQRRLRRRDRNAPGRELKSLGKVSLSSAPASVGFDYCA